MKISDPSGKLIETHHLMYSGLMSWRLGKGIWEITFVTQQNHKISTLVIIQ